jgi:16S rRNA processing protein RimM
VASNKPDLLDVGKLAGVFGIQGWVKIVSYTEPSENLFEYSPWLLKPVSLRSANPSSADLKPVEVVEFRRHKTGWVARFKGVSDRNAAEAIGPCFICVDKAQFNELDSEDFYWHQLEGLRVLTSRCCGEDCPELLDLGYVSGLMETGANDVLVVCPDKQSFDDSERLVPYVLDMYVQSISLEKQQIIVSWDAED